MKALSIRQPFASAIVSGPKRIENRTWPIGLPDGGKWFVIHSGATHFYKARDWRRAADVLRQHWPEMPMDRNGFVMSAFLGVGRIVGVHDVTEMPEHLEDQWAWSCGPLCWELTDVHAFESPIPGKGRLGFFRVAQDVCDEARSLIRKIMETRHGAT